MIRPKIRVSVIVPTYNEKENVGELLRRIDCAIRRANLDYETIIVDDNSPDGTAEYAMELSSYYPVKVIKRRCKLGLSSAIIDGVKVATGDYLVVMDADLQHPPELLPAMVKVAVNGGYELVIASRYVSGGSIKGWGLMRRIASLIATLIARALLSRVRSIKDPLSGYFLLRSEVIKRSLGALNPRGFKILLEILVKCDVKRMKELPYTFVPRKRGKSKLNIIEVANYMRHVVFSLTGG